MSETTETPKFTEELRLAGAELINAAILSTPEQIARATAIVTYFAARGLIVLSEVARHVELSEGETLDDAVHHDEEAQSTRADLLAQIEAARHRAGIILAD